MYNMWLSAPSPVILTQDVNPFISLFSRHAVFLWRQQLHRVAESVRALWASTLRPASHHWSLQLRYRRSVFSLQSWMSFFHWDCSKLMKCFKGVSSEKRVRKGKSTVITQNRNKSRCSFDKVLCSFLMDVHLIGSFWTTGPGTGVPFHWHGPGYSEVIYGRKVKLCRFVWLRTLCEALCNMFEERSINKGIYLWHTY